MFSVLVAWANEVDKMFYRMNITRINLRVGGIDPSMDKADFVHLYHTLMPLTSKSGVEITSFGVQIRRPAL